jgi:serine/threonine protein kinase
MIILSKISDAVKFLHTNFMNNTILHRDLNPNNIGFDSDGTVKIFDFGLARTIDPSRRIQDVYAEQPQHDDDDDYEAFVMTGDTGTLRYMAPEVALGHPYGAASDIYSLSLVMYEVLSLYTPFVAIKAATVFHETVIKGGQRPPLDSCWPQRIQELLEQMWDDDPGKRPTSSQVVYAVEELLRGPDKDLFPSSAIQRFFRLSSSKS